MTEPVLLQETNNTVVWLRPSPVVAKVTTRTDSDSKHDVRLEHAMGSELATHGADIAAPVMSSNHSRSVACHFAHNAGLRTATRMRS